MSFRACFRNRCSQSIGLRLPGSPGSAFLVRFAFFFPLRLDRRLFVSFSMFADVSQGLTVSFGVDMVAGCSDDRCCMSLASGVASQGLG